MIPLEALRAVRTIVSHENADGPCADGRASVLVLLDAFPGAKVRFLSYGSRAHVELEPAPGMLFCDFTPYAAKADGAITAAGWANVARFVAAGAIVLDHHEGAREIVEAFGASGVYADAPGVSGARLAFGEAWMDLTITGPERLLDVRRFADLVGVRDTWQRAEPRWREASALTAALVFYPWPALVGASWAERFEMLKIGEHLLVQNEERARLILAGATTREIAGRRVLLAEAGSRDIGNVSDIAPPEVDLVVGWSYRAAEAGELTMHVSLRSRGAVHCAEVAKKLGGGGHRGAAGFRIRALGGPLYQLEHAIGAALGAL